MTVWIVEDNLMWSARLKNQATALGHSVFVHRQPPQGLPAPDVAILNLASAYDVPALCAELQGRGVKVVAHAGHKESERLELGRQAGCDRVVTNSELVHRLGAILAELDV